MPHTAINKKPDERAKKPLDFVHSDLSGQLSPADKNGYQYAMVFVDDYSGMTFHYLLKNIRNIRGTLGVTVRLLNVPFLYHVIVRLSLFHLHTKQPKR